MKRSIIITDLTRFKSGNPDVCTAGIDRATGECIRPMPYLTFTQCQELGILPGGKSCDCPAKAGLSQLFMEAGFACSVRCRSETAQTQRFAWLPSGFYAFIWSSSMNSLETGRTK